MGGQCEFRFSLSLLPLFSVTHIWYAIWRPMLLRQFASVLVHAGASHNIANLRCRPCAAACRVDAACVQRLGYAGRLRLVDDWQHVGG